MKTLILMLFFASITTTLIAQWDRIGFEGKIIHNICIKKDKLIIPVRTIDGVVLYESNNYGKTWDSLGILNVEWIDEIKILDGIIFTSRSWGCFSFIYCYGPAIFRSLDNCANWDTLYSQHYGAVNLLVHNKNIFANTIEGYIKSTDLGNTWDVLSSVPSESGNDKMFSIDTDLFFSNVDRKLYKSIDDGITWNLISQNNLNPWSNLIKVNDYFFF